jgi:hypothetical protein
MSVKLTPRASHNEIGGTHGNELRVKVTAPPADAAANGALIALLAKTLNCSRGRVELIRGHNSRHKTVRLISFTVEEVARKLESASE